jgi:hypothetical protein
MTGLGLRVPSKGAEKTVRVNKIASRFSKLPKHFRTLSSDYEQTKVVEGLNLWQAAEDHECKSILQELERAFKLRVSQKDQVEQQLRKRRAKGRTLMKRRSSDQSFLDKVSERRFETKQQTEVFRERCRHTREYEEELEDTYSLLTADIKQKLKESEELRSELSQIREAVITLQLELKSMQDELAKREAIGKTFKATKQMSMAVFISRKRSLQSELVSKETEYQQTEATLTGRAQELSSSIACLDVDIRRLKNQLKQVREAQLQHFKDLLTEGLDTRSQGLEWIVRELWGLGLTVTEEMFPSYLDTAAVRTILALAEKSRLISQSQSILTEALNRRPSKSATFSRFNDIQTRLRGLSQYKSIKLPSIHKIDSHLAFELHESPSKVGEDVEANQMPNVLEMEMAIEGLRQEQQRLRDLELRRLTHECYISNYEEKFRTDKKTLLAAIVGGESIDRYLANIGKEQKLLEEKLIHAKTYKLGQ